MRLSRRSFLRATAGAGAGLLLQPAAAPARQPAPVPPVPLAQRFADLRRHFIFEYYPWYGVDPWRHWDAAHRRPPTDVASNYLPALGPYDSASTAVLEQHAAWIKQTGAGAINVSWWGRGSEVDRVVPALMDVMADYDIHVAFHIEPYARRRADEFASDIRYLLHEYGERRRWDCFLLLANADGRVGPVFKSFSTIEAPEFTDCHGITWPVTDWVRDTVWRAQIDRIRDTFAADFDHVTLLADSSAVDRVAAAGFDGMALYDNYVEPHTWPLHARNFSHAGSLFAFNVNAGFDGVVERVPPDSCYRAPAFAPGGGPYDWRRVEDRDAAQQAGGQRIVESLAQTVALQSDPTLVNAQRGFFVAYINSFNEWHEGSQFEPVRPRPALTPDELAIGYHNHDHGTYRIDVLRDRLRELLAPAEAAR